MLLYLRHHVIVMVYAIVMMLIVYYVNAFKRKGRGVSDNYGIYTNIDVMIVDGSKLPTSALYVNSDHRNEYLDEGDDEEEPLRYTENIQHLAVSDFIRGNTTKLLFLKYAAPIGNAIAHIFLAYQ